MQCLLLFFMEYTSFLFKKVPKYLLEKRNQIIMVLFVSIFAIVFVNIYKPFGSGKWVGVNGVTDTLYLGWSIVFRFSSFCKVSRHVLS